MSSQLLLVFLKNELHFTPGRYYQNIERMWKTISSTQKTLSNHTPAQIPLIFPARASLYKPLGSLDSQTWSGTSMKTCHMWGSLVIFSLTKKEPIIWLWNQLSLISLATICQAETPTIEDHLPQRNHLLAAWHGKLTYLFYMGISD